MPCYKALLSVAVRAINTSALIHELKPQQEAVLVSKLVTLSTTG